MTGRSLDLEKLEHRLNVLLRSAAARRIGFVLGAVALVALVVRLGQDLDEASQAVSAIGAGGVALAVTSMVAWQVAAIRIAARFGTPTAADVWARAQMLKYVPVPASAVAGYVGSSVRAGSGARDAVGSMVRQTGALALGASTVGWWALLQWSNGLDNVIVTAATAGVGLLTLGLWTTALRDDLWRRTSATGTAGWAVAAAGLGLGLGGEHAVLVGSAAAAAWVAGQLVVPVPAGIGVRELAIVTLIAPTVGTERSLVIALLVRVAHMGSDVLMAAAVLGGPRLLGRTPTSQTTQSGENDD